MTTRTRLEWKLRDLMAAQGLFQTTDLLPLLVERDVHLTRAGLPAGGQGATKN